MPFSLSKQRSINQLGLNDQLVLSGSGHDRWVVQYVMKRVYLEYHLRRGTRVNQWWPYRKRAKHNASRFLCISDNDSDGLIYVVADLRLQGR